MLANVSIRKLNCVNNLSLVNQLIRLITDFQLFVFQFGKSLQLCITCRQPSTHTYSSHPSAGSTRCDTATPCPPESKTHTVRHTSPTSPPGQPSVARPSASHHGGHTACPSNADLCELSCRQHLHSVSAQSYQDETVPVLDCWRVKV